MSIVPVYLDSSPPYLDASGAARGSLLLMPLGDEVLATELAAAVADVTAMAALILPPAAPAPEYAARLRAAGVEVGDIVDASLFSDPLARVGPSDELLLISPAWYAAEGIALRELASVSAHGGMARHLLVFEGSALRTKELVQAGGDGRVRRIQRYFDPVTWPFPAGVVASLVPVSCLLATHDMRLTTLEALRRTLAELGVPSQDVPQPGLCLDLGDEAGALALAERRALALAGGGGGGGVAEHAVALSRGASIDPSARLIGPVVVGDHAVVEAGALVIGPSVLGPSAVVGRGAVVAQCLVMGDGVVPAGATVHQRVVGADTGRPPRRANRRHALPIVPPPRPEPVARWRRRLSYQELRTVLEPAVAFVALVALSPLLLIVALLVKLTSPGAVLYGAVREGKGGRPFRCLKFRSMRTNADAQQRALAAEQEMDGPQFKMTHDPRVTPVGQWLRRLNIDELPQLVNIVRGEMSFVGPRPSPFHENQICVPWREGRLSVRPGITGLWQVCRRDRASGDFHQWIHYDLLYVRNQSFLVDLKILLATGLTLGGRWPVPVERIIGRPRRAAGALALALAALLDLLGASAVGAQQPQQERSLESHPTRSFVLTLAADHGWESNVRFRTAADQADASSNVRGAIAGSIEGRTTFSLRASGNATVYDQFRDLNRTTYEFGADLSRRATPRLTLGASGSARTSLANDQPSDADGASADAALYPLALSRTQEGRGTLEYALSPVTRFAIAGRYGHTTYDTPSLFGGDELVGTATIRRRYSAGGELSLAYGAEHRTLAAEPVLMHRVTTGWTGRRGALRASLQGGIVQSVPHNDYARLLPAGALELARDGHHTSLSVRYEHSVSASYGLARLLASDEARVGVALDDRRRFSMRVGAARSWSTDPAAYGFRLVTTSADATVRARLFGGLALTAGGFVRQRTDVASVESHGVRMALDLLLAGRSTTERRDGGRDNEGERR